MTYKELIEKLFDVKLLKDDVYLCDIIGETNDCRNKLCVECARNSEWTEVEVDFGKLYANILSDKELRTFFYKKLLNAYYGTSIYVDTDSTFPMNKPIEEWHEVPASILAGSITIGEIFDDATVHGLDFKYENGKYYYKERICP